VLAKMAVEAPQDHARLLKPPPTALTVIGAGAYGPRPSAGFANESWRDASRPLCARRVRRVLNRAAFETS
jgi:hypothetical protein